MKNYFLAIAGCVAFSGYSQDVQLKDLQVPNSPAFILLDVAPTSIDRPNSSKAFAVSVLNAINQGGGLPKNYAAEFSPFWFVKSPRMNALKYWGYNATKTKQLPFSQMKLATISLAFVSKSSDTTYLSFGGRTTLIRIMRKSTKDNLINAHRGAVVRMRDLTQSIADAQQLADAIETDKILNDSITSLNKILNEKPLFAVDGAIANSWVYDNAHYSNGRFDRFGSWITLNLAMPLNKTNTNYFNLYAVGRMLINNTPNPTDKNEFKTQQLSDYGGRIELELNKLSLSYELVGRVNQDTKVSTYRSSGLLRYKISDGLFLTSAFGKNFGDVNNLISQFGISWGMGQQSVPVN